MEKLNYNNVKFYFKHYKYIKEIVEHGIAWGDEKCLYANGLISKREYNALERDDDPEVYEKVLTGLEANLRKISCCVACDFNVRCIYWENFRPDEDRKIVHRLNSKSCVSLNANLWCKLNKSPKFFDYEEVKVPKICVSDMAKKLGMNEKELIEKLKD